LHQAEIMFKIKDVLKGNKMKSVSLRSKAASLKIVFCLICLSVLTLSNITQSHAQLIADTPCDSLYYETLSSRAWLEAQREVTQNQNIILKPDSVFEYTCFDRFLNELAEHATQMLSESGSYGTPLSTTAMDNALERLVGESLRAYVTTNFENFDLLGGHPAGVGIDHTPGSTPPAGPITGGAYTCDIMNRVWQAAKCINFITNSTTDGFYTFQEYVTDAVDKRRLPLIGCGPINTTWVENVTVGLGTGPWSNDPLVTYLDRTTPDAGCSGTPIPTGINVSRPGGTPTSYPEKICLQPGCRYDPASDDCLDN